MKHYAIKNDYIGKGKTLAVLNYDEEKKEFTIDVPEGIGTLEVPFVVAEHLERGVRHVGPEWSMRWVRERLIPPTRQNIGQILRANHMERYDEYAMLIKNQGRSCQDEYYLEPMSGRGIYAPAGLSQ